MLFCASKSVLFAIAISAMVPSSVYAKKKYIPGCRKRKFYYNFRTSQPYSTRMENNNLITPGTKFEIAPSDSFDFVPAVGYADLTGAKEAQQATNDADGRDHVLMKGYDSVAEWSKYKFDNASVEVRVVPMPKESLSGKELIVKSATQIISKGDKVLCHEAEYETYLCHKNNDVTVTEVNVVTTAGGDKPSTLWVACHTEKVLCHVMNVNDLIFAPFKIDNKENVKRIEHEV